MSLVPARSCTDLKRGAFLIVDAETDGGVSNALLAAYLAMRGISTISRQSPLLNSLLGKEGYIAIAADEEAEWYGAMDAARSEGGRAASASARRFMKDNFTASDSVESLSDIYRSAAAGTIP